MGYQLTVQLEWSANNKEGRKKGKGKTVAGQ